ncbi:MAG: IMPACT family protein [Arenimonas sp.]
MSGFTLAHPVEHAIEIKQSRFLAIASPITEIDEAMRLLEAARLQSATHHCWAYKLGLNYRFSDDGEPSGTAGRPILSAIEGQQLDAVMVIVTRWYGGINLGTGGLVRAYGGAAAECLRLAERKPRLHWAEAKLQCDFSLTGSVHLLLQQYQAEKLGETFNESGWQLHFRIPAQYLSALTIKINDLSRGTAILSPCDNNHHEHTSP